MVLRPLVPFGHRLLHGPEEVVHARVADELEALLQIGRQLLVVIERTEVLFDPAAALEFEQRVRVVYHGSDLRPAADDALILRELVDLAVTEARHTFGLEIVERLPR